MAYEEEEDNNTTTLTGTGATAPFVETPASTEAAAEEAAEPTIEQTIPKRRTSPSSESYLTSKDFGGEPLSRTDYYPTIDKPINAGQIPGKYGLPIYAAGGAYYPYAIVDSRRRALQQSAILNQLKQKKAKETLDDRLENAWGSYRDKFNQETTNLLYDTWSETEKEYGTAGATELFLDPQSEPSRKRDRIIANHNAIANHTNEIAKIGFALQKKRDQDPSVYMSDETVKAWDAFTKGDIKKDDLNKMYNLLQASHTMDSLLQKNVFPNLDASMNTIFASGQEELRKAGIPITDQSLETIKTKSISKERANDIAVSFIENHQRDVSAFYGSDMAKAKTEIARQIRNQMGEQVDRQIKIIKDEENDRLKYGTGYNDSEYTTNEEYNIKSKGIVTPSGVATEKPLESTTVAYKTLTTPVTKTIRTKSQQGFNPVDLTGHTGITGQYEFNIGEIKVVPVWNEGSKGAWTSRPLGGLPVPKERMESGKGNYTYKAYAFGIATTSNNEKFAWAEPVEQVRGVLEKKKINVQRSIDYADEANRAMGITATTEPTAAPVSTQPTKTATAATKTIKRSEIKTKAAASGYSEKEYQDLLISKGVTITD